MQKKEEIPIKIAANKNIKNLISIERHSSSYENDVKFLEKVIRTVYKYNDASLEYYKLEESLICVIRILCTNNAEELLEKIIVEITS